MSASDEPVAVHRASLDASSIGGGSSHRLSSSSAEEVEEDPLSGGGSSSGSDVDEESFRVLASEIDLLESPPQSPDETVRRLEKNTPVTAPNDSGDAVPPEGEAMQTNDEHETSASEHENDTVDDTSKHPPPSSLPSSTVISLPDIHTALQYYLARDLDEGEVRDLASLLSSQRLSGLTLAVLQRVLQAIKEERDAADRQRQSDAANGLEPRRNATRAESGGPPTTGPIAALARVLQCEHVLPSLRFLRSPSSMHRGSGHGVAYSTVPIGDDDGTTSGPGSLNSSRTLASPTGSISALLSSSPPHDRRHRRSSSSDSGNSDDLDAGPVSGASLALGAALQKLQQEHRRLAHRFALLKTHNAATETALDQAAVDLAREHAGARRLARDLDDAQADLREARKKESAAATLANTARHAEQKALTQLESLRTAHASLRRKAEIAAHAGLKYEAALTHHRRNTHFELHNMRDELMRTAHERQSKLQEDNDGLRAALQDIEAQFVTFQQQQEAALAEEAAQNGPARHRRHGPNSASGSATGGSAFFMPDFTRAREASRHASLELANGSGSNAAGATVGQTALVQYLQAMQRKSNSSSPHQRADSDQSSSAPAVADVVANELACLEEKESLAAELAEVAADLDGELRASRPQSPTQNTATTTTAEPNAEFAPQTDDSTNKTDVGPTTAAPELVDSPAPLASSLAPKSAKRRSGRMRGAAQLDAAVQVERAASTTVPPPALSASPVVLASLPPATPAPASPTTATATGGRHKKKSKETGGVGSGVAPAPPIVTIDHAAVARALQEEVDSLRREMADLRQQQPPQRVASPEPLSAAALPFQRASSVPHVTRTPILRSKVKVDWPAAGLTLPNAATSTYAAAATNTATDTHTDTVTPTAISPESATRSVGPKRRPLKHAAPVDAALLFSHDGGNDATTSTPATVSSVPSSSSSFAAPYAAGGVAHRDLEAELSAALAQCSVPREAFDLGYERGLADSAAVLLAREKARMRAPDATVTRANTKRPFGGLVIPADAGGNITFLASNGDSAVTIAAASTAAAASRSLLSPPHSAGGSGVSPLSPLSQLQLQIRAPSSSPTSSEGLLIPPPNDDALLAIAALGSTWRAETEPSTPTPLPEEEDSLEADATHHTTSTAAVSSSVVESKRTRSAAKKARARAAKHAGTKTPVLAHADEDAPASTATTSPPTPRATDINDASTEAELHADDTDAVLETPVVESIAPAANLDATVPPESDEWEPAAAAPLVLSPIVRKKKNKKKKGDAATSHTASDSPDDATPTASSKLNGVRRCGPPVVSAKLAAELRAIVAAPPSAAALERSRAMAGWTYHPAVCAIM